MRISLFEHNEAAYTAAVDLMSETGKAAIIHPTGTGKSFIAFKLCEDNPDKRVCWLSPSEYIFKTQIENLKKTGAEAPQNIRFFTYAKLMYLSADEMREIQPDFIILDEFHRCGAEMWGKSVDALLAMYPAVPLLGLSATNIRYLDNQRDMADELFDGNIASEMTLGEAIVRGILNPPKYVLSIYGYQDELHKYEDRIRRARNKIVVREAEEDLQSLRRALEKADGLDVVFEKHMEDKHGKYIVFCSNVEHLNEMKALAPEWFSRVDKKAHIYCAYSDEPETSKEFADFKSDNSSHLKLLYCIDMLNEGIHVEDISGVILLRPTVSPIVYKQQIGRALSASKERNAVIFDVVLNIENLCSIDTIEEEMQIVMTYYLDHGMENKIVNREFKIIDEVRDCIKLFNALNKSLSASWDLMYEAARNYYQVHGNLRIPKAYVTEDGFSLGTWLMTQRRVYNGSVNGILTAEQIQKLNDIGMRWQSNNDAAWETNFAAAKAYYEQHGHLLVKARETYNGVNLGAWITNNRANRKNGLKNCELTAERIAALDEIGMVWDIPDYIWEQNYNAAMQYHRKHGDLNVPASYVTTDGIRLGTWLGAVRRAVRYPDKPIAKITDEQIEKLNELGMCWKGHYESAWDNGYAAACRYKEEYGNLNIPYNYRTSDGFNLGGWIRNQRDARSAKNGKISAERIEKLNAIGMVWEANLSWNDKFELLRQYYSEHGDWHMPGDYTVNGIWLSRWLCEQRARLNGKSTWQIKASKCLTQEQTVKLASIGIYPDTSTAAIAWDKQYAEARSFYEKNGHLTVPQSYVGSNGRKLGAWLTAQRRKYKNGELTEQQVSLLNDIGIVWAAPDFWQTGYEHAKAYYSEYGNLNAPSAYVCPDGYTLGCWITNQRASYCGKGRTKLSKEQIELLNAIGMIWSFPDYEWQSAYESVKKYKSQFGNLNVPRSFADESGRDLYSWLYEQKRKYQAQKLSPEKTALLTALGFDLHSSSEKQWNTSFELAEQYYRENGDLRISSTYRTPDGRWLGIWVRRQRQRFDKLTSQQIQRLDSIGMVWEAGSIKSSDIKNKNEVVV